MNSPAARASASSATARRARENGCESAYIIRSFQILIQYHIVNRGGVAARTSMQLSCRAKPESLVRGTMRRKAVYRTCDEIAGHGG